MLDKEPDQTGAPQRFVRMASLAEVERLIDARVQSLPDEMVPLPAACGRVLAETIASEIAIPLFSRSAMDGFAVQSMDLATATHEKPVLLSLIGQSRPNRPFTGEVGCGETIGITTGAPLPVHCDAVVRQEHAFVVGDQVRIAEPVSFGHNVSRAGEDVFAGEQLFAAGRVLRPQDLGGTGLDWHRGTCVSPTAARADSRHGE